MVDFVKGLWIKPPHAKAPDYVKCKLSIRREDFMQWLHDQDGEWCNLDIMVSQNGSWYAKVNDWKPDGSTAPAQSAPKSAAPARDDLDDEDLPF